MNFVCVLSGLLPDTPVFLGKKVIRQDHKNVVESKVVGLGSILKFFYKSGRIRCIGPK